MINSGEGFRVRRHNAPSQYIEITEGDGSRHEIKAEGTKEFRITNTTAESSQGFHFYRNSAERLRILGDGLITFQDGAGTVAFTSDLTSYLSGDVGFPTDLGAITGATTDHLGLGPDLGSIASGDTLVGLVKDFGIIDSYISLTELKAVVSASTDFADFKTRIADL